MVKIGVLKRVSTLEEAREENFKAFAGVLMPNVVKFGTAATNVTQATQAVKPVSEIPLKELSKLAGSFKKELDPFFKSGGLGPVPSKRALEVYYELAKRIVNKTGDAAKKATQTALKEQADRMHMIEDLHLARESYILENLQ